MPAPPIANLGVKGIRKAARETALPARGRVRRDLTAIGDRWEDFWERLLGVAAA